MEWTGKGREGKGYRSWHQCLLADSSRSEAVPVWVWMAMAMAMAPVLSCPVLSMPSSQLSTSQAANVS